ncbi:MAG: hypothetical protein ACRCXM_01020 [Beijerinckiaceae bacterium]
MRGPVAGALVLTLSQAAFAWAQDGSIDMQACEKLWRSEASIDAATNVRCRQMWADRVEYERQRVKLMQDERARLRGRRPAPVHAPAPLENFFQDWSLTYGDVVFTDKGPRVFVGRSNEQPRAEDFLPLNAQRSPVRGRAGDMLKAGRPRERLED